MSRGRRLPVRSVAPLVGVLLAHGAHTAAAPRTLAAPEPGDLARNLVDSLRWTTLEDLALAGAEHAALSAKPWSGWYWPFQTAGIAFRYGDPAFPRGAPWSVVQNYLRSTRATTPTDRLSPAEKYDLLVGDSAWGLTEASLRLAQQQAVADRIAPWKGLCAGWANASLRTGRPSHSVDVLAADGRTWLTFLPDDIKALSSLLWARGTFSFRSAGKLCFEDPISTAPPEDRPLHPECRDTNPATLHLALTNQIAGASRSLILDSDPGNEIWNQPIAAYSYTYFHPVTGEPGSRTESRIEAATWSADPFREFRAAATRFLVGVEMRVDFVYEKEPQHSPEDDPSTDVIRSPIYRYDLELSAAGEIIGGEWRTALHPDLLWSPSPTTLPTTPGDRALEQTELPPDERVWSFPFPPPASWRRAALRSSEQAQPLAHIVWELLERTTPLALSLASHLQGHGDFVVNKPEINTKGTSP